MAEASHPPDLDDHGLDRNDPNYSSKSYRFTCSYCGEPTNGYDYNNAHLKGCEPRKKAIAEWRHRTRPRAWRFDQYVGVRRAEDLGLWKSDTDPNRTWTVPGTVAVTKDEYDNHVLTIEADGEKLTIASDRDQWGTYYTIQSGKGSRKKIMAQEDGKRSFLRAFIAALQHMEQAMDYETKDPDETKPTPDPADPARTEEP